MVPAEALLTEALALWRGSPRSEAREAQYAAVLTRRLGARYSTACDELIRVHSDLGRPDLALPIAERMAEERAEDPAVAETLDLLRRRLREARGGEILRRGCPALRTAVSIVRGDLFDQRDAHLVVGFADTFDIVTDRDIVISRASVQGQLLERVFSGRTEQLETALRRSLRQFAPCGQESARDKPKGKRTRYPIGTVAVLAVADRRVFATAYSRLGNDLVARSSADDLQLSLDRLWASIGIHGQYRPVAMPIVGSGLARITEIGRERLLMMIVDGFLRACRENSALCPDLRIIVRPAELEKIRMSEVARHLEALDDDGLAPAR